MTIKVVAAVDENYNLLAAKDIKCPEDRVFFHEQIKNAIVIASRTTSAEIPDRVRSLASEWIEVSSMNPVRNVILSKLKENPNVTLVIAGGGIVYQNVIDDFASPNLEIIFTVISNRKGFVKLEVPNFKIRQEIELTKSARIQIFNFCGQLNDTIYHDLMKKVLDNGELRRDRTGVGTISLFGESVKYSLENGQIPLLTTKYLDFSKVMTELLWFLSGSTN
ncbi:MAG: thymidylate synthase [Patescibacteria group bacterium]